MKQNKNIFADEYSKGKEIFLGSGNCASCHSLTDAGSDANIGPNLNEIRPNLMRVLMSVTNGAGVMPSYQGILTEEEIKAVEKKAVDSQNEIDHLIK